MYWNGVGSDRGSIGGTSEDAAKKAWDVFNAVGTIAYAFSFADYIPQIQLITDQMALKLDLTHCIGKRL